MSQRHFNTSVFYNIQPLSLYFVK